MDKQQIIDYVMETPGNTNPAILSQMIDEIGGGGGGVNLHTATLTFVGSSDTAVVRLDPYFDESTGYLDGNYDARPIGSYVLPLYNTEGGGGIYETAIWNNGEQLSMTSNGDITINEEQDLETGEYLYRLFITGDCTITISQ